ncbi:MAG: oligosaccharyl transferase, archaeosortase A system-associated [Methanoregula sp.]|jgi:dolichyl-diphosphooligosaccharide--protein glycosyltransferase|uniref:oligosaccharyl transferase, archaeosortase A system-associated n=1 Tax=Methanoregula sp. TaxID=2052170 RepID=UPI003C231F23
MSFTTPKWNSRTGLAVILLIFMAIALALRLIPALFIKNTGFLYTFDTDGWYTLRQIEVMVHHFPQYNWFDPMTAYPTGKFIDWGPLYPFIAAALCLITGATSQASIVSVAGWVSPIMAALMVPVVYNVGKTIWNWQAGIVAAGLVAVISYHYFFLSSYGLIGHHIAEVFISTIFVLIYLSTIVYARSHGLDRGNIRTFYVPVLLAALAGVTYFCALLASPTVIIVLVVIGIYTIVQCIVDYCTGHSSSDLLVANGIFLSLSAVLLVVFGFHATGISIAQYSPGLVYLHLALLAETIVLFALSHVFCKKKFPYLLSLVVLAGACSAVILLYPPFTGMAQQAFDLLFGSMQFSVGVVETLPLTLPMAWNFFGLSLILTAGGFLVLGYYIIKRPQADWIFLLIWSIVMLLLTIRYQRFDYYSTVNIVLLSAICITEPFRWQDRGVTVKFSSILSRVVPTPPAESGSEKNAQEKPAGAHERSGQKKKKPQSRENRGSRGTLMPLCLTLVFLLTIVLVGISVCRDIVLGLNTPDHELSPDWIESVTWLGNNTPATEVDYFGEYPSSGYVYPNCSYGIMTSWDAGHWITFFAHRIPITNPFQDNLAGSNGAAAYFLEQNESRATAILSGLGGRYIIVDSNLAGDTFTSLIPWADDSTDISPYITWFMLPEPGTTKILDKVHRYNDGYFRTMVSRLYNFDGSMTTPTNAEYIEYEIRQVPAAGESAGDVNGYARVISGDTPVHISSGTGNLTLIPEGQTLSVSDYAGLYSSLPYEPVATVPALEHYRLVHESPGNATVDVFPESNPVTLPDIKSVKIFEFVKGAQITGDGIIEVPVITNTGRTFVYRQASENRMFIVPYPTSGSPYDVKATGPYHILGTDRYVNVTENDVVQGNPVS